MLTYLEIIGFQTHERLEVQFDEITVFVGKTDSGKSAVVRALRWLFLNQPSGHDFLSWNKEFTKVTAIVDGHKIVRKKGKGFNYYSLDGKKFQRVDKEGVPEEISKLLRVDEVNFQLQLDGPFWFMETPGQLSRQLNRIINLGVIDLSLGDISSTVRKAKSDVGVCEERISKAIGEKKKLSWVVEADSKLKQLEFLDHKVEQLKQRKEELFVLLQNLQRLVKTQRRSKQIISIGEEVIEIGNKVLELEDKCGTIQGIFGRLEDIEKLTKKKLPSIADLESWKNQITTLSKDRDKISRIIIDLEEQEGIICHSKKSGIRAAELLKTMMKGRCPVCGKQM